MKKVLFEYVDCLQCADLERQLAQAQRKLERLKATPHVCNSTSPRNCLACRILKGK